jgi:tetratricopeptide (TPR) repeat protein
MSRHHRRRRSSSPWARRLRELRRNFAANFNGIRRLPKLVAQKRKRRTFWKYALCLPALFGIAFSIWEIVAISYSSSGKCVAKYQKTAEEALAAKNFDVARWCNRKLLYLTPDDEEPRVAMALIAEKTGDKARAERLMRRIAPLTEPGYPQAHLWLARKFMNDPLPKDAKQQVRLVAEIQQHLRRVVDREPRNMEARASLGKICAECGQIDEAISNLSVAVASDPTESLTLGQLYLIQGNRSLAEVHGKAARDHFQSELTFHPGDVDAELGLAAAELFLGEAQRAIEVLSRGSERSKDRRFEAALTSAYVLAFDQTNPAEVDRRLELIQKAWNHGPDSAAVNRRLTALAGGSEQEARQAKQTLEEAIKSGKSPGIAHYAMVSVAAREGDYKIALAHAEAAFAAMPNMPEMENNLAYLLAKVEPPDLQRAIKLADAAVAAAPNNAHFRETRGEVLLKLQRYRDAAAELELALAQLKDLPAIHASLAEAYQHLGDAELAAKHKALAAEKAKPKPK